MKISTAQLKPVKGDIEANIDRHVALCKVAIDEAADLIFFPELSLTSYESVLAKELATTASDPRFAVFQNLSDNHDIIICAGVPTATDNGTRITMMCFQKGKPIETYSKQLLHVDELPFFIAGEEEMTLNKDGIVLTPGICYESLQPVHIETAITKGTNVYLASVAKSATGVEKAFDYYPMIARKYGIYVLMSNCLGPCDDFESVGCSAVWNQQGELLASLGNNEAAILVLDTTTDQVKSIVLGHQ